MGGVKAGLAIAAILGIALCARAAADTLEDAKREGEVIWYTSMNVSDADAVLKPFRERRPFLEISFVRATSDRIRNHILSDAADGRSTWDVVAFRLFDVAALIREGLVAQYRSPEIAAGAAPGTVDPDGRWAALFLHEYVIAYNTRLVKAADAPKSWQDLLGPNWAGRFALDEGDLEWYAGMLDYWGRERGGAFMRALGQQKPQRVRGHQALARQLAAGAFPLALVYSSDVEAPRLVDAPVQLVKNLDPVIVAPTAVAISSKAPHPAAARLLVDYLLSKDGQQAIRNRNREAVRTDVQPAKARTSPHTHPVNPRLLENYAEHEAEFRRVLGKR
jgi:iron(III) transport system substrate-binding protein